MWQLKFIVKGFIDNTVLMVEQVTEVSNVHQVNVDTTLAIILEGFRMQGFVLDYANLKPSLEREILNNLTNKTKYTKIFFMQDTYGGIEVHIRRD